MSEVPTGYARLRKGQQALAQALHEADPPRALAHALKQTWPEALLGAAWLGESDEKGYALDEHGTAAPDWVPHLGRALRQERSGRADRIGRCGVPRGVPVRGPLRLACLRDGEKDHGFLVIALPEPFSPRDDEAEACLGLLAEHLVLHLRLTKAPAPDALPPERAHVLADLVSPLSHDLHNVFNGVALQAAILSRAVPEELREKVALFRTLALRGGELLASVDRFRHSPSAQAGSVSVGEEVERALAWCRDEGITVTCQMAPDLPPLPTDPGLLARAVWLLVRNAHAAGGKVAVRLTRGKGGVTVSVRDRGPRVPNDQLANYFELTAPARGGEEPLERVACQGLVRQMGGVLRAVNPRGKGLEVRAEFPVA